jgi:lysophospholipase L1-like esterase
VSAALFVPLLALISEAFPGQHPPTPSSWKYPVWPAACDRLPAIAERLACDEFVLDDWPRLSRYADANAALAPSPSRVVFMGDSITDDWDRFAPFFPNKPYVNRGIAGQTTAQMLLRFRADVVALAPAAVVILAGINDLGGNAGPTTPEAIQNNLASMADLAAANRIRVVLASILPVSPRFAPEGRVPAEWARAKNRAVRSLNEWIRSFAAARGHVYLDLDAAVSDGEGNFAAALTRDGLHPNRAGYAVMAPLYDKAIARALTP